MEFEILTANYNNSIFLDDYFSSLFNSTLKPNKIIFVDDCSTDDSLEIVKKYQDLNIIDILLIRNEKNIGFANSLNNAIENLTTKYFARLDPDDAVRSTRFEVQLNFLLDNPSIDVIGTNVSYFLDGEFIKNSDVVVQEKNIMDKIRQGILPVIHGSIMGKTEVLTEYRYKQEFVPAEDYDLFAFIVSRGFRITNLIDPLTLVTIHKNSVSNNLEYSTIKKRFFLARDYFGFEKNWFFAYLEYLHQYFYRRYLYSRSMLKYFYLFLSAFVMPIKSLNKILNLKS